jgi:hypothetical protein
MMTKPTSNKTLLQLSLISFFVTTLFLLPTKAEGTTPSNIEVSPSNFVVLENDLGKKLLISIKNNTTQEQKFTIQECISIKENNSIKPLEEAITKSAIEIDENALTIKAGATGSITTRVRISASGGDKIPCVIIKPQGQQTQDVGASTSFVVPYIIQNFKGEQKFEISMDIGKSGIVTDSSLTITGSLKNTGDKFFTPQGTVIISKNGTKLAEKEITTQINGLMLTQESKTFSVKWDNALQGFDAMGEYKIEVKISTDQAAKTTTKQIIFNYIPQDLILIAVIAVIALLLILVGLLVLKKK